MLSVPDRRRDGKCSDSGGPLVAFWSHGGTGVVDRRAREVLLDFGEKGEKIGCRELPHLRPRYREVPFSLLAFVKERTRTEENN